MSKKKRASRASQVSEDAGQDGVYPASGHGMPRQDARLRPTFMQQVLLQVVLSAKSAAPGQAADPSS